MTIFSYIKRQYRELAGDASGLAYIEFAFSITLLLLMFFGAIEISRYFLIIQTVEKTIATVTDVTAQSDPTISPLTDAQLTAMFGAVPEMMDPYSFNTNGIIILSDVSQASGVTTVNWQVCGGGTLSKPSKIGTVGGSATLPTGFTLNDGQEVIFGEIYYNYSPILAQDVISAALLYRTAIYLPRYSSLASSAVTSNCS
jgi:Flp pilus assembly protein TadG